MAHHHSLNPTPTFPTCQRTDPRRSPQSPGSFAGSLRPRTDSPPVGATPPGRRAPLDLAPRGEDIRHQPVANSLDLSTRDAKAPMDAAQGGWPNALGEGFVQFRRALVEPLGSKWLLYVQSATTIDHRQSDLRSNVQESAHWPSRALFVCKICKRVSLGGNPRVEGCV